MSFEERKKLFHVKDFYVLDKDIIDKAEQEIIWFRKDFDENIVKSTDYDVGLLSAYSYILLRQLHDYYNDGICVAAALAFTVVKEEKVGQQVKAFHLENLIFRLVSFWDFYYNLINQYLQLEFVADNQIKEQMIENACNDISFEPCDDGLGQKMISKPKNKEEQKIIRKDLNKQIKVINLYNLKSTLYEKFYLTPRFKKIIKLMDSPDIKKLKRYRNQIIHRRPLGANISIDYDVLMGQTIASRPNGWCDLNEVSSLILQNINIICDATQTIYEVISIDERPNFMESKGKDFYVYNVTCENCGSEDVLPKSLINEKTLCSSCWKRGIKVREKRKSNEINYGHRLYQYYEKFNKHVDDVLAEVKSARNDC